MYYGGVVVKVQDLQTECSGFKVLVVEIETVDVVRLSIGYFHFSLKPFQSSYSYSGSPEPLHMMLRQ